MKIKCIGSSSSGNCYLMQFADECTNYKITIMIECGFSWGEIIKKAVEIGAVDMLQDVSSCLITHGHNDHAKAINQLISNGIDIFTTQEVANRFNCTEANIIKDGESYCIAPSLFAYAFKVEHDFPNTMGYVIKCEKTNETILFVTDCKYYTQDLSDFKFNYILMECNYDEKMTYSIYNQVKKDNDQLKIKQYERVINSHMSMASAKKNLKKLNLENTTAIFLLHLSDKNANEYKMKNEIKNLTNKPVYVCQKKGGIK